MDWWYSCRPVARAGHSFFPLGVLFLEDSFPNRRNSGQTGDLQPMLHACSRLDGEATVDRYRIASSAQHDHAMRLQMSKAVRAGASLFLVSADMHSPLAVSYLVIGSPANPAPSAPYGSSRAAFICSFPSRYLLCSSRPFIASSSP